MGQQKVKALYSLYLGLVWRKVQATQARRCRSSSTQRQDMTCFPQICDLRGTSLVLKRKGHDLARIQNVERTGTWKLERGSRQTVGLCCTLERDNPDFAIIINRKPSRILVDHLSVTGRGR